MLQQRGDEIRTAYEENEKNRNAANELKSEYEKRLQEAKKEAELMVQKAVETAEKPASSNSRRPRGIGSIPRRSLPPSRWNRSLRGS